MQPVQDPRRATSLPRILLYALGDLAGMLLLAAGALWLANAQPAFLADFPASLEHALLAIASGLVLMVWSAGRLLRELGRSARAPRREGD